MRAIDARHGLLALFATSMLMFGAWPAPAQISDFPNRKLTLMVGFAPGGGIDTMARVVGQGLADQFNYQIVIENRPGAASNIAARAVANSPPDGYTLLATGNSLAINQIYYKNPGYTSDELTPVAFPARDSMAIAVKADNPARTLAEFVAAVKGKPFSFGFGGSSARIGSEYVFKVLLKTQGVGVPFQSGLPAINALLGNHVDVIAGPVAEIFPQVQQGALRALVVTGAQRSRVFPDVQTLNEAGLKGIDISGWNGVFAPAKIAPEVAQKLNADINAAVKSGAVGQRLRDLGYEPYAPSLAEARSFFHAAVDAWARMIREAGISGE